MVLACRHNLEAMRGTAHYADDQKMWRTHPGVQRHPSELLLRPVMNEWPDDLSGNQPVREVRRTPLDCAKPSQSLLLCAMSNRKAPKMNTFGPLWPNVLTKRSLARKKQ